MKYLLMHKRTVVLELDIDKLGMIAKIGAVSAPEHLPVGVRTSKSGVDRASFNEWWADRCIPASRYKKRRYNKIIDCSQHYCNEHRPPCGDAFALHSVFAQLRTLI